uniref:IE1 protein n=8 Tax=Roseolovirus TaxID=40272 RepID=Q6XA73_HHV6H|nr:IE1 protein [Human betaherpesvirus 6B]AAP81085.1 IE1 protein [Human betaherpesvirus 6B]APO37180.1 regulatory protein IE1 [Human betaherpesvirus 6B]
MESAKDTTSNSMFILGKPSGNNMESNEERMQNYHPDPVVEESIKEILEESLKCDVSFESLLFPELEAFDLFIPESSNDIASKNVSYSSNVEEGASEEFKTLVAQSVGTCIQSIGASVKAAMKQELSNMEDDLINSAGLLTLHRSMLEGLVLEQLGQLININLLSSVSSKFVSCYAKMLSGKNLDFFNWCEPRFIVFACDKFDGLVKKMASESRDLLMDLKANMNNQFVIAIKNIFSKAYVALDCEKLNTVSTSLLLMAHNKEMSNPDISNKDFCGRVNLLKQELLESRNEIIENHVKNMKMFQEFANKQMNQIFMDNCDRTFLKIHVNCKNLITAAKNISTAVLQSIVLCSSEFSWQYLKPHRHQFKITIMNMITHACECLETVYDDTGLIKPLTSSDIMEGYIAINKDRESSICDLNIDPSESILLELAEFDEHGKYSEESSIESIHEDDDNVEYLKYMEVQSPTDNNTPTPSKNNESPTRQKLTNIHEKDVEKMYPDTPSPDVPGKSKEAKTFIENSRQIGKKQTSPNCVCTASVTDLGGPNNFKSITGLESCKHVLIEKLLETQPDSVVVETGSEQQDILAYSPDQRSQTKERIQEKGSNSKCTETLPCMTFTDSATPVKSHDAIQDTLNPESKIDKELEAVESLVNLCDGFHDNPLISEMITFGYETDHSAPYESESDNNDETDYIADCDSTVRTNNIHMNNTNENTPFSKSLYSPPEVTPSKENDKTEKIVPVTQKCKSKKRTAKRKNVPIKPSKSKKIKIDKLPETTNVIVISSESEDEEDGNNNIDSSILKKTIKSEPNSESSSESDDCTSEDNYLHLSDYDKVINNGHCKSKGFVSPVFTIPIRSMPGTHDIRNKFVPKKNWLWFLRKTHKVDNCVIHSSAKMNVKNDSDGTEANHCFINHFVPIKMDDEEYNKDNVSYTYSKIQDSKTDLGVITPTKKLITEMVMENFMDLTDIIKHGIDKHCQDLSSKYTVITSTACEKNSNVTNSQSLVTAETQIFDPQGTGNNSPILNIINDTTCQNDENRCMEGTSNDNEKCTIRSDCNSDKMEVFKLDGYPSDYDPFEENAQIY